MTPPLPPLAELADERHRVAALREYLAAGRAEVRRLHEEGGSGSSVAAEWSGCCDALVAALFQAVLDSLGLSAEGLALFALGEFGRRTLAPHSGLDLLLVYRGGHGPEPVMAGLLRPLWDARLEIQGVARTPQENHAVAREDARSLANLLEGRWLGGDPTLGPRPDVPEPATDPAFDGPGLAAAGAAELAERHARYGGTVYLLEPQLVEGQGGLRDIHAALWAARCRFGVRTSAGLVQKGLASERDVHELDDNREYLLRLRNHLHLRCGRREDRLRFDLQDDAAEALGYRDTPRRSAAEALLQDYYARANQVGQLVDSLLRRATARSAGGDRARHPPREVSPGVRLQGGEVFLDPAATAADPLRMLAAFEAAQLHDAELSPQALAVIRDHLPRIDDRYRRDPEAVALFLRVLQHPRRVAGTLMRMHDVRFLDRFIPELRHTFGRVQRDPYHAYPVDVHSLFAVQELRRLAVGEYREEFPAYTRVMAEVTRPHLVYLGTLLHDVGKGHGSRHEERGAELAIQVADRMDLPPGDRAVLEFLVREHLSLAVTAQSRDLHDEELIAEFAARVGDPELLRMLHLLTFADARAVGPTSWSSWKHLLFTELYEKALAVLETGPARADLTRERVEAVRRRLRTAARPLASEPEVEAFLEHIDHPRYLLANPLEVLLRHLTAFLGRGEAPVVELRAVPAEGYAEALVLARDRPGLFATLAGLLAAQQINVLSAVLNTRTDGWAVDVFHVTVPAGEPLAGGPRWEAWHASVADALAGPEVLPPMARRRLRSDTPAPGPLPPTPPRVRVDNDVSTRFTVVDLSAPDRLGLLYDVARALAEQGLTIRLAKIATLLHRVEDAFYVEEAGGGKLTDPDRLNTLQRRLEAVAEGNTNRGDPK